MDLRRIIGGECAVGVEAASVGFVDKTNFAPQRYELILKRQRKCEFFFFFSEEGGREKVGDASRIFGE